MGIRKELIDLEFQSYIEQGPVNPRQLYAQACSNDDVTVSSWKPTWLKNVKENKEKFNSFKDNGIQQIYCNNRYGVGIIAGSGPSLRHNAHKLKDRKGVPLISCLHNFHMFEDLELETDLYVSLDAGDVTIEEVYEGGKRTADEYWSATKGRTLVCYIASSPRLLDKWKGKILFFNAPVPDEDYMAQIHAMEPFHAFVSNGGNVLGACLYINKGWLGSYTTIFVGADFSFSNENKFHAWDSKYDLKLGNYIKVRDVFGMPVKTWQSYFNFKCWFDYICQTTPGEWINCTEGGCLGAYDQGNIRAIKQMTLDDALKALNMSDHLVDQAMDPAKENKILLF